MGIAMLALWSSIALATTPINLGTSSNFAILTGSTVTNSGYSLISGDLGISPGSAVTGFPPGTLNGTQYLNDAIALQAQRDLLAAYNDAAGRALLTTLATELGGMTVTQGVHNSASGTFEITGILTLDGQGDPNAVFIFQMATTIITASRSHVNLIGGAQASNVYWQVGSSATLGSSSGFIGNILAYTSVTIGAGVSVNGRALAQNGAVTLDTDTITVANGASAITPDKHVTLVTECALHQNYPNPFNPTTSIVLDLAKSGYVSLRVYNLMGQEVARLTSGSMEKGSHIVYFDGSNLSSGAYLYRASVNGFVAEKKMLLMK